MKNGPMPLQESSVEGSHDRSKGVGTVADLSRNHLLAEVPAAELELIRSEAQRVRSRMREVIYAQGAAMDYVLFPENGVFSLLAEMSDGTVVETLTVGNEGMIGLPALMGATRSPTRAICQITGLAFRVPVDTVREAASLPGSVLFSRLARYAHAQLTSLSRSVACNRIHTAQQRYARWVLTRHDRVGTDEFPITQDFLAQMLGVTRPTVSLVGQELHKAGLIHYAKGRLTVDDRTGLEGVTCECYWSVRESFNEMLGIERG
jgi:CRP-like cAMP-binding protein